MPDVKNLSQTKLIFLFLDMNTDIPWFYWCLKCLWWSFYCSHKQMETIKKTWGISSRAILQFHCYLCAIKFLISIPAYLGSWVTLEWLLKHVCQASQNNVTMNKDIESFRVHDKWSKTIMLWLIWIFLITRKYFCSPKTHSNLHFGHGHLDVAKSQNVKQENVKCTENSRCIHTSRLCQSASLMSM